MRGKRKPPRRGVKELRPKGLTADREKKVKAGAPQTPTSTTFAGLRKFDKNTS